MEKQLGQHEVVVPNQDLPFRLFLFEGKDGKYIREKHWHRSIEIFAVYEGTLDFFLGEENLLLHPGEFVIVNSNEVHSIHAPKPNHTVVIQMPMQLFASYFTEEQFIWFAHAGKETDNQVSLLVKQLFHQYEEKRQGYEFQVLSLFYQLVYLMITQYRKLKVEQQIILENKKLNRLGMITSFIQEHYREELSLKELAEIFGYSSAYLSRMFQKYAKINYKDYLQSVRLEHATEDLKNTEHTISQIALDHGFPNSKAFSNLFRKTYGHLPGDYRKRSKK